MPCCWVVCLACKSGRNLRRSQQDVCQNIDIRVVLQASSCDSKSKKVADGGSLGLDCADGEVQLLCCAQQFILSRGRPFGLANVAKDMAVKLTQRPR